MKYALIVPDGMADRPLDELRGKTPMEASRRPAMQAVGDEGVVGLVQTIPEGMANGSDVANMSLMGFDPHTWYTGRAPLEAAAMGVDLGARDWAFRCNLVTVADGEMADYSAGHISTAEARLLIDELNRELGTDTIEFHAGVSYRHLVVFRDVDPLDLTTAPPHDIAGQAVAEHLPTGTGAEQVNYLMDRSAEVIAATDVNRVRLDLGQNPATQIWLWGQGQRPQLPSFKETFGVEAGLITAVDLLRGLANLLEMEIVRVPGATGYIDTDYAAKGRYAIDTLKRKDMVYVHVEAPDEASHGGMATEKIRALERIDAEIVRPVHEALKAMGDYRILIVPDHATSCDTRGHLGDPVPFAVAGKGIRHISDTPFTERGARKQDDLRIDKGHQLMEYFLTVR